MTDSAVPNPASARLPSDAYWYLVGFVDKNQKQWRTIIRSLPLTIGRHESADLYLYSTSVSRQHAELFEKGYARPLDGTLDTWTHPPLNAAADVAGEMRKRLGL